MEISVRLFFLLQYDFTKEVPEKSPLIVKNAWKKSPLIVENAWKKKRMFTTMASIYRSIEEKFF